MESEGLRQSSYHKRTVEPMDMTDSLKPVSEQTDPFYIEYLELESSVLDMITQTESRLSLRALGDQDDPIATEARRAVARARITVGKADAAVRGQLPIGDTDWCLESTKLELVSVLRSLNVD